MQPVTRARNLALQVLDFASRRGEQARRDARNVDLCLSALCKPDLLAEIRFPVAYIDLLRTCVEHAPCSVEEVKHASPIGDAAERFTTLLATLRSGVPPLDFHVAAAIAARADHYRSSRQPLESAIASDVGHHFEVSSSFGKKGRILTAIIRFMRAESCLEAGTAYGMSASFILEALRARSGPGHLQTLEGWEPLFALSAPMLNEHYGDLVTCHLGDTRDRLSSLARSTNPISFMFHDAGHSRDDYLRDFNAVKPYLGPHAVVFIDDIRYEDLRISHGQPLRCYEGWREVCADPRVVRAVEIDGNLGLLLVD